MEVEDLDAAVLVVLVCFLARVELSALVDKFAAGGAFHGEGCHKTDGLNARTSLLGAAPPGDIPGVEIGRIVFLITDQ